LRIWNVPETEPIQILDPLPETYLAIAWHPLENKLAIADHDQTIIYDLDTDAVLDSIDEGASALAWRPDGHQLAGGLDRSPPETHNNMWLWDLDTGQVTEPFKLLDVENFLQWNHDGTMIASSSGRLDAPSTLPSVGHLASGNVAVLVDEPRSFYSRDNFPIHTAWHPNRNEIALAHADGLIEIFRVQCETGG
jgi:WD40 repeat protein